MFTVMIATKDDAEFDTAEEVVEYLGKFKPEVSVRVEAPAGPYTGVDFIPYGGRVDEVKYDLRQRYRL